MAATALKDPYRQRERRSRILKAIFLALIIAVFLALALIVGDANYRPTALAWIPVFAVVFALVLAWLYVKLLENTFKFADRVSENTCERGSNVTFTAVFQNPSPLFILKAEPRFFISDLFGNVSSVVQTSLALSPHETYEMPFNTRFEHIGVYTAGLQSITLYDFLGLFSVRLENKVQRRVRVLPKIHQMEGMHFSAEALIDTPRAYKSVLADTVDYSHVRDYAPGDPMKNVHWKLSAHTEKLQTRLFEAYTNPGVIIIPDFYAPFSEPEDIMGAFDCVVESAFTISRRAQMSNMACEIVYKDDDGVSKVISEWGRDDLPQIVEELPTMTNSPGADEAAKSLLGEQVLSGVGYNNLVVCSANLDVEVISSIVDARLRRRSPVFIAVVPRRLVGKELEDHCKILGRLDAVDIPYLVVSSPNDLEGRRL